MSAPSCSICFSIYAGSDDILTTPCGHIYHRHCLVQWFNESQNEPSCPKCRKICYRSQLQPVHLDFTDTQDEYQTNSKRKGKQRNKKRTNDDNANTTDSPSRRAPGPEPYSYQNTFIRICDIIRILGPSKILLVLLVFSSITIWKILENRLEIIEFLEKLLIALVFGIFACVLHIYNQN